MQKKPWWKSKAIWGFVIAMIGVTAQNVDQHFGTNISNNAILEIAIQAITYLGGILGVYGRVKAKTEIE